MRYFFLIVKMIINQFVTPNCISNAEAQREKGHQFISPINHLMRLGTPTKPIPTYKIKLTK